MSETRRSLRQQDHSHLGQLLTYAFGSRRSDHRLARAAVSRRASPGSRLAQWPYGRRHRFLRRRAGAPAHRQLRASPTLQARRAAQRMGEDDARGIDWSGPANGARAPLPVVLRDASQPVQGTAAESHLDITSRSGQLVGVLRGTNWFQLQLVDCWRQTLAGGAVHIDTGDQASTKALLDALRLRSDELEALLECKLEWERLDNKRARRLATYHAVADQPPLDENTELQTWAVATMVRWNDILRPVIRQLAPVPVA